MKFNKKAAIGLIAAATCVVTSVAHPAYGTAGQWDNIGSYDLYSTVRVNTGGGDLEVCITGDTHSMTFSLDRGLLFDARKSTSYGGTINNCAVWRDIGSGGWADITLVSTQYAPVYITVYD